MTMMDNNRNHARKVAKQIGDSKPGSTDPLTGIWNWINGVSNGLDHFFGHTILNGFKVILQNLQNIGASVEDALNSLRRIVFWVDILVWHVIRGWIEREHKYAQTQNNALARYLIGVIHISTQTVLTLAMRAVNTEKRERLRQVRYAEAQARAEIKALHHVIEQEASSGYRVDNSQRTSIIVKLLDFAAERNPAVRAITRDIAGALLDLLSIDDPILRITVGFLIKQVIDRLGIDKAMGALISDLLDPIIGKGPPKSLHDTIMDISDRLIAMEKQWAKFMQDGGSQVEQAGTEWRNITSIATSAALVGFTVEAVANPDTWASAIADTVGQAANDVGLKAAKLFGA